MDYRVSWEIDVNANSPEEAANIAREIQLDPDSIATSFDVTYLSDGIVITQHSVDGGVDANVRHFSYTVQPTVDQLAALRTFAAENGRYWKSELRQAWMGGVYITKADSSMLQQVRNQFGPAWLTRFKLGK